MLCVLQHVDAVSGYGRRGKCVTFGLWKTHAGIIKNLFKKLLT